MKLEIDQSRFFAQVIHLILDILAFFSLVIMFYVPLNLLIASVIGKGSVPQSANMPVLRYEWNV